MQYEFMHYCTVSGGSVDESPFGQDERHPDCIALKLALSNKFSTLIDNGIKDFFINAEYGIPLWAGEILTGLRQILVSSHRVHICVPYEEQAARWSDEVRERYYNLHETADSVTMLRTRYTENCYQETDHFMLNQSVMLLTDNSNAALTEYARKANKHIEKVPLMIAL